MPALFALGQHQALEAIQESLQPSETLMAFLDDVYVTTPSERTATVEQSMEVNLWSHARIQVNQGKTQVWNRCGERPPECDHLFFSTDGTLQHCPPTNGASLFLALLSVVRILLRFRWMRRRRSTESCWRGSQRCDLQCAWLLLLFCAVSRASHILRVVHLEHSFQFALRHDQAVP